VVGGIAAADGRLREAAVWLLVSGLFDMVDGAVARRTGLASRRGAFLDSSLDRLAEGAYLSGLGYFYAVRGEPATVLAVFLVLTGSLLVSYVRARAEGLGVECKVGLMERPERFVALVVGGLLAGPVLPIVLWILAGLTLITAAHRVVHVYGKLDR
jgi:CDP-diacylglycerol--glycerol-3-phosphate 3-phosphatidyltransferase